MPSIVDKFAALCFVAFVSAAHGLAWSERKTNVVPDYTVLVDPPTGYVFVKLPAGWRFVGMVAVEDLSRLPATVETTLLVGEDDVE